MVTRDEVSLPKIKPVGSQVEVATEASSESVIDVRGLRAFYGSSLAVKDIDLSLRRRRVTAVIGPSGCGKEHAGALSQPDARDVLRGLCGGPRLLPG